MTRRKWFFLIIDLNPFVSAGVLSRRPFTCSAAILLGWLACRFWVSTWRPTVICIITLANPALFAVVAGQDWKTETKRPSTILDAQTEVLIIDADSLNATPDEEQCNS